MHYLRNNQDASSANEEKLPSLFSTARRAGLLLLFGLLLWVNRSWSQSTGWVTVDAGKVLVLTPVENSWEPTGTRQEIPLRTYLLTSRDARSSLFRGTDEYPLPSGSYFFAEDAIARDRVAVVEALTRIEIEQLPDNVTTPDDKTDRPIGLIYGKPPALGKVPDIPNRAERIRAIEWFADQGRYAAALLSLKRVMTKYPQLYFEADLSEQLLGLYARLELFGFLFDESERLLDAEVDESFRQLVVDWNVQAKKQLAR